MHEVGHDNFCRVSSDVAEAIHFDVACPAVLLNTVKYLISQHDIYSLRKRQHVLIYTLQAFYVSHIFVYV